MLKMVARVVNFMEWFLLATFLKKLELVLYFIRRLKLSEALLTFRWLIIYGELLDNAKVTNYTKYPVCCR